MSLYYSVNETKIVAYNSICFCFFLSFAEGHLGMTQPVEPRRLAEIIQEMVGFCFI